MYIPLPPPLIATLLSTKPVLASCSHYLFQLHPNSIPYIKAFILAVDALKHPLPDEDIDALEARVQETKANAMQMVWTPPAPPKSNTLEFSDHWKLVMDAELELKNKMRAFHGGVPPAVVREASTSDNSDLLAELLSTMQDIKAIVQDNKTAMQANNDLAQTRNKLLVSSLPVGTHLTSC